MICKRCDRVFECNVEDILLCKCSTIPVTQETISFLQKSTWGCLCSDCLTEIDCLVSSLNGKSFPTSRQLKQGRHYYIENGMWVFTEQYHVLRGSCCKSRCRHCPYGFKLIP